ncbi:hypothetical protein KC19_10G129600 [Ceratodon purpureus]|uniref:ARMC9 CTLH-like domain-containing protein n=2 Tax=Ceratodon purpureus TaxID=3225 RepID=A0A8T0GQ24_CERPU|nr:hypothetical protein KC19_10G129600 [Ceratodon purpureus]
MDQAMQFAEAAVREFLLFRGFTNTLEAFHSDLYSDVGSGFQVGRILDLIFRVHVPSFEAEKLVNLLAFLNSLVAASADVWLQETAKQLECNLKRYYIVHALQRGRADRVLEFFQQHAEGLLRSGDRDWFVWFAIPYVTNPGSDPNFKEYFSSEWSDALELSFRKFLLKIFEGIRLPALLKFGFEESKCVALEKELEQMREVINTKDDEIAYLRRDSPRHGSDPRVKKVVPDYRVSPPVTHIKSPLSSGGSIEERENEGDNEAAAKDEFNPSSTSGDFSESGKSSERTNSSKWRPLLRRNSSIRSTYSGGSQLEKTDFEVSDATNSREKEGEVSQVAIQYQEAFSGHTSPITKCRYSATGAKIAITSVNGTVRILSSDVAVASSQNATISAGAEVLALEWEHLSDRMLLFGTAERNIKAWNVEAKRVVCDLTTEAMFPRVLDLRCSPTDSVFCCAAASETTTPGEGVHGLGYGSLTIWNMRTWKAMTSLQLGHEPPVMTSVCFNDNGKILAAGATDGKIRIFDLRENLPKIGWPAHAGCAVSCVRFGHDQNSVFSLGADGKIFEWSLHNQGQVLHKANASSYCALPSGTLPRHEFAIGSGGRYVLLTSNTTTAPLYKWGSPLTHKNLEHTSVITSVDRHPSLPMFLTGSSDHSIRVTAVG